MAGYNTNLASEFYVLSVLYRLGLDANLTLGNKKAVDITVVRGPSDVVTIDVKAVAKGMDWPISKGPVLNPERHFLVLVCYNGKFSDPRSQPDTWVVPYDALGAGALTKKFRSDMTCVIRSRVLATGSEFRDRWDLLKVAGT